MATLINVLIVEDSQDDADLVLRELRRGGFDPKWKRVETEPDFLAEIKNSPDIILSDYSMPQFSGLRAAKLLQESGLTIPFILISGTVGEDVAVEAMKHGATDYLLKDRIARLGNAVESALEQKRLRVERERVEKSLNLFRMLVDRSTDGIEVIDPETGRFLDVNETTCQRLGYSRGELLSMTVMDIDTVAISPATWASHIEGIRQAGFRTFEGQHRREDGSTFPIEINARYITLDRDYLIAAVRDITERKEGEIVLRESERRFRELMENVELIAMTVDNHGIVTFCNDHLLRLTGWKREEIIGADWFARFIPATDTALKKLFFDNIAVGKIPPHHENSIKTKDGRLREIAWNNTPLRDVAGKFTGVASIGEDVTERKLAEQALRESEEKFRQIAENINEVFWITDPTKNQMLYISPAYEKIWGRTRESLYQSPQSWLETIHPEDCDRILQAAMTRQPEGTYDEEYRIVRPDKSVRWIRDRAFPIHNQAGQVERVVGVARDITEQRKLEEQFRQSQKMEAIGQLASGVAHDFNNVLAVIQMQAGLVEAAGTLLPAQLDYCHEIGKAVQRAANLTRQLLMFSRKQALQPRDLDLNDIVSNITKMLHRVLGEDMNLIFRYSPEPLFIHADAGMMEQILLNLTVNSRDAMPKGGQIVIEISAVELDELTAAQFSQARAGSFVCLGVADTGCGISKEILPHIFEPFFTTKDVGKGTGLGLATVFGIVQQHQGWINVYSEAGQGTKIRIYLPRLAKAGEIKPAAPSPAPAKGGNETILLLEDDSSLCALIQRVLTRLGYRVYEASTSFTALEIWKLHRNEIHLLLTDLVLPDGMNGIELARKLLQDRPELKVIYASGYSADVAGKDFHLEHGVNFLSKPFEAHKLAQTIRAQLDSIIQSPSQSRLL